jgi:hypothetical protein
MTTINIDLYSLAALVDDEYDRWTKPSFVQEWIHTLEAGHTLTSTAIVWAEKDNTGITLKGDIIAWLTTNGHYELPAGTKVSLVVTEPLRSENHGPYNWSEYDSSGDTFSHQLGGIVTIH